MQTSFLDRRGNLTLKRGAAGRRRTRVKSCSECSRSDFGTLRQQQQPERKA